MTQYTNVLRQETFGTEIIALTNSEIQIERTRITLHNDAVGSSFIPLYK